MASDHHSIGSTWLQEKFGLQNIQLTHISYLGTRLKQEAREGGIVIEIYPSTYAVEESPLKQIEFALKYDDLNLDFLKQVFEKIKEKEIVAYILSKPKGSYQRRIGYLYEFLLQKDLEVKDVGKVNYIDLVDPDRYMTGKIVKVARWAINDNLMGISSFCPVIRKTPSLVQALDSNFQKLISEIAGQFPDDIFHRTVNFLYTKETKSSYKIEKEEPSPNRLNKFISILEKAGDDSVSDLLQEDYLTRLQNEIVDPRFVAPRFRDSQNFISQTSINYKQIYHYVCPPPQYVPSLMDGLLAMASKTGDLHPIVQGAIVSFGFVFIHPFEDGNGRIHRFLIHDFLTRRQLVKRGMIIPVSAHMLNHMTAYNKVLESYSKPLMKKIEFTENDDQTITVTNSEAVVGYFRYPDLTNQCFYLAETIHKTITEDIFNEMDFLFKYDEIKLTLQKIVDLPDKQLNLFITFVHQNKGSLPKRRRNEFERLSDDEIVQMEKAFQAIFEIL